MDPTVTQQEALQAFQTLGKLLQEVYHVPRERLLSEVDVYVPTGSFRSGLSPFSAIATYLHKNGVEEKRIAQMLGRNRAFVRQSIADTDIDTSGRQLPINIFRGELSILEAAAQYLRNAGLDNKHIADELGKTTSAIWTLLKRADEKRGGRS